MIDDHAVNGGGRRRPIPIGERRPTPADATTKNSIPAQHGAASLRKSKVRQKMARPKRFELLTPRFVVWCSIQLSYGRAHNSVVAELDSKFPNAGEPELGAGPQESRRAETG